MSLIELFDSIKNNNLNETKKILKDNPNYLNEYLYGATPFLYSIECKNEPIAMELCEMSSLDVHSKDNLGLNSLESAIENRLPNLVKLLAKRFKRSDLKALDFNVDPNETLLTFALKFSSNEVAIGLLSSDIDLNEPNKLNEYPIELAIKYNKIDVVREMLKEKSLKVGVLANGYNPLIDACENDLNEIAIMLMDSNRPEIDISYQLDLDHLDRHRDDESFKNWTPLMHCVSNGNEELAVELIKRKCYLFYVGC